MTKLQIKDLNHALTLQMAAGNAILLLGLPGIGKTQIAQQWLANHTAEVVIIDGSQTPAELVQGVPYVGTSSEQLHRELMDQMNRLRELLTKQDIIVGLNIEELSSFSQDDQRTVMNMVLAGQLPDGTRIDRSRLYVVATANPSAFMDEDSDASVNDIENALMTRMAVYEVEPDVTSWLSYAQDHDIHPAIAYALRDTPDLFTDVAHRTVPRTLTFLSNVLHAADRLQLPVLEQDFEALIGSENAAQFKYIYEHVQTLVSLVDVVTDATERARFEALSDAEKSFVWLSGLSKVAPDYDPQMRELAEMLPSDTLIASFKTDTIWARNADLQTTRFLAGAWQALQDIE